ncbi:Pseudouridine-5'-phosphate glycosidase [Nymphaea thermarum]|nr:Pseudouridine-5'-phosphate glycosidase [Nymphaea thermarum]
MQKSKVCSLQHVRVPIPEAHAASGTLIELAIKRALEEARDKNIVGNAATPFLLARVNELTSGASLAASILYDAVPFIGTNMLLKLDEQKGHQSFGFIYSLHALPYLLSHGYQQP